MPVTRFTIRNWLLGSLGAFLLLSAGCEKIDKEEPIPGYLQLEAFRLDTTAQTGSNSNRITDYWVYIDDNLLGDFEFPVSIPVLKSGKHKVEIRAGVRRNGAAGERISYPFYASYVTEVDFQPNKDDTLRPVFTYHPGTQYLLVEDFEDSGTQFKLADATQTFTRTDDVFKRKEPNWSGVLQTTADQVGIELQSIDQYLLNREGDEVWLEFDYKTNLPFEAGLYGNLPTGSVIAFGILELKANTEWNHIYIRLTDDVSAQPSGTKYTLYLRGKNFDKTTAADVYIDNVKLLQFKR